MNKPTVHPAESGPCADLDEHIRRVVDQAPQLSAEQRERIVVLLRPPSEARGRPAA